MAELRERMIRAMQLRNYSPRTQKSYVHCIVRLTRHYRRAPDGLSQREVENYLLHLMLDRGYQASSARTFMAALRFFYLETLGRDPRQFLLPSLRPTHKLPEILSADEIVRLFQAVENRKHRVLLMTTYSAGLRVSEAVSLRLTDIHSERMMIRVEQGGSSHHQGLRQQSEPPRFEAAHRDSPSRTRTWTRVVDSGVIRPGKRSPGSRSTPGGIGDPQCSDDGKETRPALYLIDGRAPRQELRAPSPSLMVKARGPGSSLYPTPAPATRTYRFHT